MTRITQPKDIPHSSLFTFRERLMLIGLMVPTFLALMDIGMLNVALPSIQSEFGLPVDLLGLVVAARNLPRLGLMPVYGVIGDRLGKKRIFMFGLAVFAFGTLIALFSPSLTWLIFARLLQGLGGASLPLSMALITDAFTHERRGRALGIWNAAAPIGMMLGPFFGGMIIEVFGWRSIFALIGSGAVIAFLMIYRLVPSPAALEKDQEKFDWFGAVAIMTMVSSILVATTTTSLFPFGSPLNFLAWAMAGAGLIGLAWNASTNQNPILRLTIFRNRRFTFPSVAIAFRMFAHTGVGFLLVLYLANVFAKSPSAVGTIILFYSLALTVGIPLGGWLADRWASRKAGASGLAIQTGGILYLALVQPQTDPLVLVPALVIGGLGTGVSLISFTKEAVESLGQEKAGLASGLFSMVRFTGSTLSAPILGLVLAAQFEGRPGAEFMAQPYQVGFLILALSALCGAVFAALIPPPVEET